MRNTWTLLNIRKQHSTLNHPRFNERWTIFHPSYKKINVFCICHKGICRLIGLSSHMQGFKGSKIMQPITCPKQYSRDGYWGSSGSSSAWHIVLESNSKTMKYGCVSGLGCGCGCGTWQFWKSRVWVRRDSAIKKLLKIFLFIFSIYFYY